MQREQEPTQSRHDVQPVVCVLGAGPGLGLASARAFAAAGYRVALVGRREESLAELAGRVDADGQGVDVGWAVADVADPIALTAALDRLVGHAGRLDVLHHNVSRYRSGRLGSVAPEELAADLAVGVVSLLSAVRACLPALRASGGSVLVTGGAAADRPMVDAVTLGVQKAALRNLLLAMAPDLAEQGVHAATLTVQGVLAPGTRFDPALVASRLVAVSEERRRPVDTWVPVQDFDGADDDGAGGRTTNTEERTG